MKKNFIRIVSLFLVFILLTQQLPLNAIAAQTRHRTALQQPDTIEANNGSEIIISGNDNTSGGAEYYYAARNELTDNDDPDSQDSYETESGYTEQPNSESGASPNDNRDSTETTDVNLDSNRYLNILLSSSLYSLLSEDDSTFICQYTGIDPAVLVQLETAGYSLGQSIQYALLSLQFMCDIDTAIEKYPATDSLFAEINFQLTLYLTNLNENIFETALDAELRGYILDGKTYEQVRNAYGIYRVLGVPIYNLLYGEALIATSEALTQEEIAELNAYAGNMGVSAEILNSYVTDLSLSMTELENLADQIRAFASSLNSEDTPISDNTLNTNRFLGAPTCESHRSEESINLCNGSLTYETTAVTIPGVNGLDFSIGHRYSLQNANKYWESYEIH